MNPGQIFNPWKEACGFYPQDVVCKQPTKTISQGQKLLYVRMVRYAGRDGQCFPGQEQLGADLGVSGRQVRKDLLRLEALGLIQRRWRQSRRSNSYEFLWHEMFDVDRNHSSSQTDEIQDANEDLSGTPVPLKTDLTGTTVPVKTSVKEDLSGTRVPVKSDAGEDLSGTPVRVERNHSSNLSGTRVPTKPSRNHQLNHQSSSSPGFGSSVVEGEEEKKHQELESSSSSNVTPSVQQEDEEEEKRKPNTEAKTGSPIEDSELRDFMARWLTRNGRVSSVTPIDAEKCRVMAPGWSDCQIIAALNEHAANGDPHGVQWFPRALADVYERLGGQPPRVEPASPAEHVNGKGKGAAEGKTQERRWQELCLEAYPESYPELYAIFDAASVAEREEILRTLEVETTGDRLRDLARRFSPRHLVDSEKAPAQIQPAGEAA